MRYINDADRETHYTALIGGKNRKNTLNFTYNLFIPNFSIILLPKYTVHLTHRNSAFLF